MKIKTGVLIIFILLFTSLIFAQNHSSKSEIDRAYSCLESNLGNNCGSTKSTNLAAFNLLSSSYKSNFQSDCKASLNEKKKDNCWAETDVGNCNIKSTSLAILALSHIGDNVDSNVNWLLSKKISQTGLIWYLEIDTINRSECDINGKKVIVEDNKKISGTPPSGLVKAYNDYWFEIKEINQNYSVSCDKNFITALIYQKPGSNVFHVSSETKSASSFDSITEKVNSNCLSTSNICDYEGTLWGATALSKQGKDVDSFIPFLTSMADAVENKKYLPSAFLYILTGSDDYYSELISLQKNNNYWDESRNKFYDTALALLTLQNINSNEVENAKRYLLKVQESSGCWQSDTPFILYAGWPKSLSIPTKAGISYCEDFSNYCVPLGKCDLANTINNFYCSSSTEICCKTQFEEPTCLEKQGIVCNSEQECNGNLVASSDTNECCVGDCVVIERINDCENAENYCKDSCSESEEEKLEYSNSCEFGQKCCARKPPEKTNYLLIILLIILILLVTLAIIFRNQLKIWLFRLKTGYKSQPQKPVSRPPPFQPPRSFFRPPVKPIQKPPRLEKDKEFEDTMKRLRDMSK